MNTPPTDFVGQDPAEQEQPAGSSSYPQAVIEVAALRKTYLMGNAEVHAVRDVSLQVASGEFVALMGASGSGKSTLMHLLGCLDTPTAGTYYLEGRDVSALSTSERARVRSQRIGFVFQSFNLLTQLAAVDNVALPLLYRGDDSDTQDRALEALTKVGLADRSSHRPVELSGGERQRVAIARALVADPALILADEPTGNLDSTTGDDIMGLLAELHLQGRTIILVTHDAQVARYAQRTILMRDGLLVTEGASRVAP